MEFSTENLLFVIELIMVKYQYQQKSHNIVKIPRHNTTLSEFNESSFHHVVEPTPINLNKEKVASERIMNLILWRSKK